MSCSPSTTTTMTSPAVSSSTMALASTPGQVTRPGSTRYRSEPMGDRLGPYRAKRDFGATPEPEAGVAAGDDGLRYVVQEHHARSMHWDLRLEHEGTLASWAVPKGIPPDPE